MTLSCISLPAPKQLNILSGGEVGIHRVAAKVYHYMPIHTCRSELHWHSITCSSQASFLFLFFSDLFHISLQFLSAENLSLTTFSKLRASSWCLLFSQDHIYKFTPLLLVYCRWGHHPLSFPPPYLTSSKASFVLLVFCLLLHFSLHLITRSMYEKTWTPWPRVPLYCWFCFSVLGDHHV